MNLLRCSVEDSVDEAVRQVSAISFKNAVKKGWDARNDDGGLLRSPPCASGISAAISISPSWRLNPIYFHAAVPVTHFDEEDKAIVRLHLLEAIVRSG